MSGQADGRWSIMRENNVIVCSDRRIRIIEFLLYHRKLTNVFVQETIKPEDHEIVMDRTFSASSLPKYSIRLRVIQLSLVSPCFPY